VNHVAVLNRDKTDVYYMQEEVNDRDKKTADKNENESSVTSGFTGGKFVSFPLKIAPSHRAIWTSI